MTASQRAKGQRGEREFCDALGPILGLQLRRNIGQTRTGGADILDIPGWAVEVKRQEGGYEAAWWVQALRQAQDQGKRPALAYRASRRPWRVRVELRALVPAAEPALWAELDLLGFAAVVMHGGPVHTFPAGLPHMPPLLLARHVRQRRHVHPGQQLPEG